MTSRNTRSTHSDDEGEGLDLHRMEVSLRALLQTQNQRLIQACNNSNINIEQNAKSIAELNELLLGLSMQVAKLVKSDGHESTTTSSATEIGGHDSHPRFQNFAARMTKVGFPKFDGTDLRSWLYKCNQFFQLDEIKDPQKVRLAAIHLEGKALLWHQTFIQRCSNVLPTWDQYTAAITVRFGDLYDDPMADLKALKQQGSVQEYHDAFDALSSRLTLSEEYLLSCYLGGLDDEIQLSVRMFTPKSIQQALCLAKLQEASCKAQKAKANHKTPILSNPQSKYLTPNTYHNNKSHPSPLTKTFPVKPIPTHTPNVTTNRRTLTPAELSEKRAKNLCFWCDERYTPGHKCKGKKPQFFHIEMTEDEDEVEPELESQGEAETTDNQCAHISLEAVEGISSYQTMRVTGHHGKKLIKLLLDSGNTHNFIDASTALKLDCTVEEITPMGVRVADGGQLVCDKRIKNFPWRMQGVNFKQMSYYFP